MFCTNRSIATLSRQNTTPALAHLSLASVRNSRSRPNRHATSLIRKRVFVLLWSKRSACMVPILSPNPIRASRKCEAYENKPETNSLG
ncbi:hypothetical protein BB8028_0010g00360 [Beauveria bassiana]|uniref:Uncharacterized protein n=1 Tax=Beauveria bassiana TaxID=176275 RepID=A0A2S7YPR0_BEABA|nr:hypothetical protein BB8028_0010g00360 [Beauveria bassiana]